MAIALGACERSVEVDDVQLLSGDEDVARVKVAMQPDFPDRAGPVEAFLDAVEQVLKLPGTQISDEAHAAEHSLEVHLPFLQVVLEDFSLVPLLCGDASADEVAAQVAGAGAARIEICRDVQDACARAGQRSSKGDRVVVFGSFFVVGPALEAFELYSPPISAQENRVPSQ